MLVVYGENMNERKKIHYVCLTNSPFFNGY